MANGRPDTSEYPQRYGRYVDLVPEEDICSALALQLEVTSATVSTIPKSLVDFRYAPGKWTTREVVGHILDTERIFGFRLLTFARGDSAALTRADEVLYVRAGEFGRHGLEEWLEEYALVRRSHIALLRHLPELAWSREGTVAGSPISVRAIAYAMLGHERHHLGIIQTRYVPSH
jgi:hypothetical protein